MEAFPNTSCFERIKFLLCTDEEPIRVWINNKNASFVVSEFIHTDSTGTFNSTIVTQYGSVQKVIINMQQSVENRFPFVLHCNDQTFHFNRTGNS